MNIEHIEEIKKALIECSFKSFYRKGARICYPNQVLMELFGDDILIGHYISELGDDE